MGKIVKNGVSYCASSDDANNIKYNNSISGLDADTIQGAIDKLDSNLAITNANMDSVIYKTTAFDFNDLEPSNNDHFNITHITFNASLMTQCTNAPVDVSLSAIILTTKRSSTISMQMVFDITRNITYTRIKSNNVWASWVKKIELTTVELPVTDVVSGANIKAFKSGNTISVHVSGTFTTTDENMTIAKLPADIRPRTSVLFTPNAPQTTHLANNWMLMNGNSNEIKMRRAYSANVAFYACFVI